MKLTILGSGTVVPDGERNSAGYYLEAGEARLMLDCGAGTVHALARYGVAWQRLTHLFISHFHVDHCGELASLFFAFKHALREPRAEKLTLVGPQGLDRVLDGLRQAFGATLFDVKFPFEVRMLAPGERLPLSGAATLAVAKTPHTEESLAARVESGGRAVCYTGDTDFSEALADFFRDADALICECSFKERREGVPHLSIRDAARLAARAGVRRLILTHFYFEVDEAEIRRVVESEFSGALQIARDGLALAV